MQPRPPSSLRSASSCGRHSAVVVLLGLLLAGCGPAGPGEGAGDPPVTEITVTGDDRMRFAPEEFTLARGSRVTVVLRNIGTMPKEVMGHNLVVLKPGTYANGFAASSLRHPENDYVAPGLMDVVVAHTPVIGPGETYTLEFTVPEVEGDYPFACTFPGHTPAGMVGVMRVR